MASFSRFSSTRVLAFALAAALGAGVAHADKPEAGEKGGKGNSGKGEQRESPRGQDMDRGSKGPQSDHGGKGPQADHGRKGPQADHGRKGPQADHGRKGPQADHGGKGPRADHAGSGPSASHVEHFGAPHRTYVHDYYDGEFRAGKKCPPGLAKKNNGCMPPGQAKKWDAGYVLPREVRYYDVPAPLVLQLGQPQPGYRYVRVNDDILLLATGTRMIVDVIRNLGR